MWYNVLNNLSPNQVPALLLSGVTVVISPLNFLMQDQVKHLNAAGVHAAYINSSHDRRHEQRRKKHQHGHISPHL